ncbi:HD domain-containing protein [uncultured Corynebacterium sp.]|uniref:HD domain-containing protein n=1 Tax=uncultured Corynebacterium sp. TaxID=159447 RepID=UPI0025F36CC3|nr:HD domain-containing protein [uncultured Corynebacterium sp.]
MTDVVLTPRLTRALAVAAEAHDGHYRKATAIPYVSHVYAVMHVASRQGLPAEIEEDVLIACLLHDTLEDVSERYGRAQMLADFGPRVVSLVEGVTKDSTLAGWRERSEAYLEHLRGAEYGSVVISACDKLHNLTSILEDYAVQGEALWDRFNSGKEQQQWWYGAVLEVVSERAPELPLLDEYRAKVAALRAL